MKIVKLFQSCTFDCRSAYGGFDPDKETGNFLKSMHPSQWLGERIKIPIFKVSYRYTTARGNLRTGEKYFMKNEGMCSSNAIDMLAEMYLNEWVEKRNKEKPFGKISNVEILGVEQIANAILPIEF